MTCNSFSSFLFSQLLVIMFLLKIALLAFLASFATFSYAIIPSESESHPLSVPVTGNPKVLISDANILLEQALIPFCMH
jgi:hypothetical protein